MKRPSDDGEEVESKRRQVESETLKEIRENLMDQVRNANQSYDIELEEAKHKYYVSYFKQALEKLPHSKNILEKINIEDNRDGFYKCFSIAKMCVKCELDMKKYIGVNMVVNMFSSLVGKLVHANIVSPYFTGVIDDEELSNALLTYQSEIAKDDAPNELQCVAYLIQNEMENESELRIPNPMFDGLNKQISAVSKYVVEIIKSVANKKGIR